MKEVICKDCEKMESVPDSMPEPWICKDCQELHKQNESKDFDLEQEMEQQLDDAEGQEQTIMESQGAI